MIFAICRQPQECDRCAELQQHIAASNAEFARQQGQYEAETTALRHAMGMARAREAELAQQVRALSSGTPDVVLTSRFS